MTSSGLVLGPTKSKPAKICSYEHALQDYRKFSRGRAGTLRNKVLKSGLIFQVILDNIRN